MDNEFSIVFTGDIGFDKYMNEKWNDDDLLSEDVRSFIEECDHLVVNVEGPLLSDSTSESFEGAAALKHSMSPQVADFLNRIGADVWNIDNNHIMDAGAEGLERTLDAAQKCKAKTLGAGMNLEEAAKPVVFDVNGGIGLVAVGYERACRKATKDTPGCLNWSNMETVEAAIANVKKSCRWCIVVAHDGEEFTALPSPYVRDRYHRYLEMGADIVVAHHPHVPMNYETVDKKIIFYSLGNFIFDTDYQRSQQNTDRGILLKLCFNEEGYEFEPLGIRIDRDTEHIVKDSLPDIFEDIKEDEYEILKPLAAAMLLENTKRQCRYLYPDKYNNASDEDWYNEFHMDMRSGCVPGQLLDFKLIYELAMQAESKEWEKSKLEKVKQFMLEQM